MSNTCKTHVSEVTLFQTQLSSNSTHLEPGVLSHVEASHPQVCEEHLSAVVSHKGPES